MAGSELMIKSSDKVVENREYQLLIDIADNGGLTSTVTVDLTSIPGTSRIPAKTYPLPTHNNKWHF